MNDRDRNRTCDGVTSTARFCRRQARYVFVDAQGCHTYAYCSQHLHARGPMRLLRPFPWEFVRVFDLKSGTWMS